MESLTDPDIQLRVAAAEELVELYADNSVEPSRILIKIASTWEGIQAAAELDLPVAAAGILAEAGLKVGLHVSPYLQSATEKIWIDGRFVSSDEFDDLLEHRVIGCVTFALAPP